MTTPEPANKPGTGRRPEPFLTRRQFLSTTASVAALSAMGPAIVRGTGGFAANSTVAIVRGQEVGQMVAEAMELLGGPGRFVKDGQKVTLKPNCVYQPEVRPEWQPSQPTRIRPAFTTHVELVEALVQQLQKAAKCSVTMAEGTPESASRMFDYLGYREMAKRNGVQLVDVDESPRQAVSLVDGLASGTYDLPAATQNCDVFMDLPVLKNHHVCGVSAGMKSLFGLLRPPKQDFHKKLNGVLCDLVKATHPALTLVDALYGMEGQGPLEGRPVKMDLVVAGTDIVAVDVVRTALMGFDPLAVEWEDRDGQSLRFAPELLRVNSARYPQRKSFGFTAWYRPGEKVIMLEAQYEVLIHVNRKAAEEELRQWVQTNLGEDIEPKLMADF